MNKIVNDAMYCNKNEIINQNFPIDKQFSLVVTVNEIKFEFLLNIKNTDKILIYGFDTESEDINSKQNFPNISSKYMHSTIKYNKSITYLTQKQINDCYLENNEEWYYENIAQIIQEILNNIKIKNKNVIFYGNSSYGFTAIMLSILFKDSVVIAENPYINLSTDPIKKKNENEYFEDIYDNSNIEYNRYERNIFGLIKQEKYMPNLFLILNWTNKTEYEKFISFLLKLNELNQSFNKNNIQIRIDNKKKKDNFLNYEELLLIINNIEYITTNSFEKIIKNEENNNIIHTNKEKYKLKLNNQIKKLENDIFEKNTENLILKEKNKNKDYEIDEYEKLLSKKDEEIRKLKENNKIQKKKNRELEEFKKNVYNSNSWKYTEILRKIRN